MRGRPALAPCQALLCSASSPVAGAFLALAFFAWALACGPRVEALALGGATRLPVRSVPSGDAGRPWARPLALTIAALAPIAALAVAFPEGGMELFAPSSFWPALAGVLAIALLTPRGPLSPRAHRAVRIGAALYALVLVGAFAISSPLGGNAARLGPSLPLHCSPACCGIAGAGRCACSRRCCCTGS